MGKGGGATTKRKPMVSAFLFGKRGGQPSGAPACAQAAKPRLLGPAYTLVDGLSYDPNARKPNTRKHVYKKVDWSLLNVSCLENTFHLKNIGIVDQRRWVRKIADDKYEVGLPDAAERTREVLPRPAPGPDRPSRIEPGSMPLTR